MVISLLAGVLHMLRPVTAANIRESPDIGEVVRWQRGRAGVMARAGDNGWRLRTAARSFVDSASSPPSPSQG